MIAIYNGELVDSASITISPDDLIVQRGFGIFDFFRIQDHVPLFLEEHLTRFINSAEKARIPLRWSRSEMKSQILKMLAQNDQEYGGVKIMLTGGVSPMGFEVGEPNLIIRQSFAKAFNDKDFEKGGKLITHEFLRDLPAIKTTNYFTGVWLNQEMKEAGAIDVLYHQNNELLELSRSNLFLVIAGKLVTPKSSVLYGITRSKVLGIAGRILPVEERVVLLSEILDASEIFLTSTLKKILPIIEIDGRIIGKGLIGKITKTIHLEFEKLVVQEILNSQK